MSSVLSGIAAAILVAIVAAYVLDTKFQQGAETAFVTEGVRL